MKKMKYTIKSRVWLHPGMAGWHFVSTGKEMAKEIKLNGPLFRRGFGSIPVKVTIGKTSWRTSIFPDKTKGYILPLKKAIRQKESISADDTVRFSIAIIE